MLLLILNGSPVLVSKRISLAARVSQRPLKKKTLRANEPIPGGVNRNTSEINVPECRRPADPYIEREPVCLPGIFTWLLEAAVSIGGARNQRVGSRVFVSVTDMGGFDLNLK